MSDDRHRNRDRDDVPSGSTLYGVTGKLYRYLARFAGEDPDAAEQAYHESMAEVTAGADPVQIGEALGDGIDLGISLAERRRALREYHDEVARRELAPPAYDTERIEDEDGHLTGLRVLVSEPDCRFFTGTASDDPELLVQTPAGGEVEVPLSFEPGPVEPVDAAETVTEAIIHRARTEVWPGPGQDTDVVEGAGEDGPTAEEVLDAARDVVREEFQRLGLDALEERHADEFSEGEPESDDDPAGWRAVGNERVHRTRDCQYLKQAHEVEPVSDPQGPRCSRCWPGDVS